MGTKCVAARFWARRLVATARCGREPGENAAANALWWRLPSTFRCGGPSRRLCPEGDWGGAHAAVPPPFGQYGRQTLVSDAYAACLRAKTAGRWSYWNQPATARARVGDVAVTSGRWGCPLSDARAGIKSQR